MSKEYFLESNTEKSEIMSEIKIFCEYHKRIREKYDSTLKIKEINFKENGEVDFVRDVRFELVVLPE